MTEQTKKIFDQLKEFCSSFDDHLDESMTYENTLASLYWSWDKSDCSEVGLAFTLVEYFLSNSNQEEKLYNLEELENRIKKLKENV